MSEAMLRQVQHIGIAVRDLEAAVRLYEGVFGARIDHREHSESEQMDVATFRVGEIEIELMQPTAEDSAVGRFIAKRGEGIHHVAYRVDDIVASLASAREAGLETLDREPRPGLDGTRVAFIHPRSVNGVLTELVEE
jgi:methylmalonyl-CoA/ethylmalonyl-CoA epimerase